MTATPGRGQLQSLTSLLATTDDALRRGVAAGARVWPTGFDPLDKTLFGGIRSGELVLLGGPQGQGKTTMALQAMRNAVQAGGAAVLFSYEHEAYTLLERLIAMEAANTDRFDTVRVQDVRRAFELNDGTGLDVRLGALPGGREGLAALEGYGGRLHVHESAGGATDLAAIREVAERVAEETGQAPMIVVDYLQKVPMPGASLPEEERVAVVAEGLKDLALTMGVPVVSIVAADKASLVAGHRMRVHDLRGSSALAYEADVVLILNDKYDIVSKQHLVYDLGSHERFRQWAVCSIEKNRNGVDQIDLEFRKRFEHGCFDPVGQVVTERLIEERVFTA